MVILFCSIFILAHVAALQAYVDTVNSLPPDNETTRVYRPTPYLSILRLVPDWYRDAPVLTPEQITNWMEGLSY